jgi:hypothetical protein
MRVSSYVTKIGTQKLCCGNSCDYLPSDSIIRGNTPKTCNEAMNFERCISGVAQSKIFNQGNNLQFYPQIYAEAKSICKLNLFYPNPNQRSIHEISA